MEMGGYEGRGGCGGLGQFPFSLPFVSFWGCVLAGVKSFSRASAVPRPMRAWGHTYPSPHPPIPCSSASKFHLSLRQTCSSQWGRINSGLTWKHPIPSPSPSPSPIPTFSRWSNSYRAGVGNGCRNRIRSGEGLGGWGLGVGDWGLGKFRWLRRKLGLFRAWTGRVWFVNSKRSEVRHGRPTRRFCFCQR